MSIDERARNYTFGEFSLNLDSSFDSFQLPEAVNLSKQDISAAAIAHNATIVYYSIVSETEVFIRVISPEAGENAIQFRRADLSTDASALGLSFPQNTPRSLSSFIDRGRQSTALAQLVRGTRSSFGIDDATAAGMAFSERDQQAYLQGLHKLLISPIADLLVDIPNDRVVFIPEGPLALVPFPALLNQDSERYLVEDFTISTASRLWTFIDSANSHNSTSSSGISQAALSPEEVLIVGDPVMPSVSFSPTTPPTQLQAQEGSREEATDIAALFNTPPVVSVDATESAIKQRLSNSRVIHLATHGLLESIETGDLPIPGAVALAPSQNDDGLLTSFEIMDMTLNADLVVLSACETALGSRIGGSVFGLPFALNSAGADSVVVSLWSIPDAPTSLLMQTFYRKLISDDAQLTASKAEALRNAMIVVMQDHPDPRNWAAFTLIE